MQDPVIVLTRPLDASRRFAGQCRAEGIAAEIVIAPIMEIVPTEGPVMLAPETQPIFTSENAVRIASERLDLTGRRVWAVGARTGEVARAFGMVPRVAGGDVVALERLILAESPAAPLCHLRGRHAAGDLVARLRAGGLKAGARILYDQREVPLTAAARAVLTGERVVTAPLFSPRTARLLRAAVPRTGPYVVPLALSAAVAEAWGGSPPAQVAERPDSAAMLRLLCRVVGARGER